MRSVVAAALSLYLALLAVAPHAHGLAAGAGGPGQDECAICVARGGEAVESQTPTLAQSALPAGEVVLAPGLPPVGGAPLGAIPGQSPPVASR
jgi:hypothetical protein